MSRRDFSRGKGLHALNELNVTPLLDLCFCLLIIFMIATPVIEESSRVDLPKKEAGGAAGSKPQIVSLTLTIDGGMRFNDKAVTREDIREKAREYSALPADSQPIINIRADQKIPYGEFAEIVGILKNAGLTKLAIAFEN